MKGLIQSALFFVINGFIFIQSVSAQSNQTFNNCNFEEILADKRVPQLAKDIYFNRDWSVSRDNDVLSLLDSLQARDKKSKAFHFKVVTKSFEKSDGYYAEALGSVGKEYVEHNTAEFIAYFDNNSCFTHEDLMTWTKIVILEFSIVAEENDKRTIVKNYIQLLKSNVRNCTALQKENMNAFCVGLEKEWREYLENE
jgi:hypothetical protein